MGFKSTFAYTRLMPFRDYSEHETVNLFSKDVTGVAGELVKIVRSNPSDTDGWSNTNVGADFDRIVSLRYEVKDKIKATEGTENKYEVLGLTLFPTLEWDENGVPLKYNEQRKRELQAVLSGEASPVLTEGLVYLTSAAYVGTPAVGHVGQPAAGGKIQVVDPTDTGAYDANKVIGRFLSASGSQFGGTALFKLEC